MLGDLPESATRRHHTVVALDLFGRLELRHRCAPAFDSKGWDHGLASLWAAIASHHGKPETGTDDLDHEDPISGMRPTGIRAAKDFAADVVEMFGPYAPLAPMQKGSVEALSWVVAGLTNLADWIGSNRDAFPYRKPPQTLASYWIEARASAASALAASGLLPVTSVLAPTLQTLFAGIDMPSPLQQWSQTVVLLPGPVLTVIEDVTGSGKTEAALVLASRSMAEHRAGGVFFALPTMATANAMFDRLEPSYRRMFAVGFDPSLVLAHGRSGLHDGFTHSILPHANTVAERTAETSGDGSSAVCAA